MLALVGLLLMCGAIQYASATVQCGKDEFPCNDGTCVLKSKWCDSIEDCRDDSDETYCFKNSFLFPNRNRCNDSFLICKDGPCIPLVGRCDGFISCDDGSDEVDCDSTTYMTTGSIESEHSTAYAQTSIAVQTTMKNLQSSTYTIPIEEAITGFEVETELAQINVSSTDATVQQNWNLGTTSRSRLSSRYADVQTEQSTRNYILTDVPQADATRKTEKLSKVLDVKRGFQMLSTRNLLGQKELIQKWLLKIRDEEYGWGDETARALTALYISDYFTKKEIEGKLLMSKQLYLKLSLALIRNQTHKMDLSELSLYINALLASCDKPRNFYGHDLIATLRYRTNAAQKSAEFVNPSVYLTLCISNEITGTDLVKIRDVFANSRPETNRIGIQALATLAASCVSDNPKSLNPLLGTEVAKRLYETVARDGLPENIYELALTVQALNDAGINQDLWNRSEAVSKVAAWQDKDGSWGNILAAYYVLPILSGKSLRSLSSHCSEDSEMKMTPVDVLMNDKGHKLPVTYSLYFGEHVEKSQSLRTRVSTSANLLDLMRIAERENPIYRFKFDMARGQPSVYAIGGIANDAEQGLYWVLHVSPRNSTAGTNQKNLVRFDGDIRTYMLQQSDHIVFWLKKLH